MMIPGWLVLSHQVKPALLFQPSVNESPSTVLFFIDLALAIVGATAGTVDQPLVAGGNGTDAGSFTQKALTTLGTSLTKVARTVFYGYEQGIQCWNDWLIYIKVHPMYA